MDEKMKEWLIKHYKHTRNKDIISKFGISKHSLYKMAKELGLKKSYQFMRKAYRENGMKGRLAAKAKGWPPKGYKIPNQEKRLEKLRALKGKKLKKNHIEKIRQSVKKVIRDEKRRILFGLEQRTKKKLVKAPPMKIHCRYKLRKYGYHIEKGGTIAYYDDNTRRSPHYEEVASKYKIKIEKIKQDTNN